MLKSPFKNQDTIFISIKNLPVTMPEEKKKYPIQHVVNWYYGNYCARKCFDNDRRLYDHWKKLQLIVEKNKSLQITHRDFLDLFNDHFKICALEDSFKRKMVSWKLMTLLQRTPEYDPDQIIVEKGTLKTKTGQLPAPKPRCEICRKLGIPE